MNKIHVHNVETNADINFDAQKSQVTMTFTVNDGDVIVIGEKDGFAKQQTIEDKRV
jgi:hypothetical protein